MLNRIKKIAGNVFSHVMRNRAAYSYGILVVLHLATASGLVTYRKRWSDLVLDHQTQSDLVVDLLARLAERDSGSWAGTRLQQCPRKIR